VVVGSKRKRIKTEFHGYDCDVKMCVKRWGRNGGIEVVIV